MGVREKLASHLYPSALDVSPLPVPVLRLDHSLGAIWSLLDGAMVYSIDGGPAVTVPLTGTVSALKDELEAAGFTILFVDSGMLSVPSGALLGGNGSTASSRSNSLSMFSSPLWTILDVYGLEVAAAEANLVQAIEQLYMNTADGEILDVWGGSFGVPRETGENDAAFYGRIVAEVLRPRNNRFAIQNAITDLTGFFVTLRELFLEIFKLDFSELSGDHHFQDGVFFTWNVFQPIYHSALTVDERRRVLEIINRNRPAGCLIVGEFVQPPIGYAAGLFLQSSSTQITEIVFSGMMNYQTDHLSSSLSLSNGGADVWAPFYWTFSGDVPYLFGCDSPLGICIPRVWSGSWDGVAWNRGSVSVVVTQE